MRAGRRAGPRPPAARDGSADPDARARGARARLRRDVPLAPGGRAPRGLPQARDRPRRRRLRGPGARLRRGPSLDRALDPSPRPRAAGLPRRVPARVPGGPRAPRVDAARGLRRARRDAAHRRRSPAHRRGGLARPPLRARPGLRASGDPLAGAPAVGRCGGAARARAHRAPLAFGLLRRMLRDVDEAAEVLQEVFWELWRAAGEYDPRRGSPEAWVTVRARSRGIDRVRSVRRREEMFVAPLGETAAATPG